MNKSKSNIKIKKCKKCGSTNIKLWYCGHSSSNIVGGRCLSCGHEVSSEAGGTGYPPTQELLTSIWNKGQLSTELEKLQAENKKLKAKVKVLNNIVSLCNDKVQKWRENAEVQRSAGCTAWADCLIVCAIEVYEALNNNAGE